MSYAVLDPSAQQSGPTALVARREDLEEFFKAQDCSLIWVITGTKWALGGGFLDRKSVGRRLICGALRMKGSEVAGKVRSWLELPGGRREGTGSEAD